MNKTKKRKLSPNLDASEYVNSETGETLLSQVGNGVTLTARQETNQFIINSDEYVVFDADALFYLCKYVSNVDRGRIMQLSNMVKGDCCAICQNNNHPHTPETLSVALDMDKSRFYGFIRKMITKNVMSYCVCAPSGYVQRIYMLNPYTARKRKNMNCELSHFFRNITKDGEIQEGNVSEPI